MSRSIVLAVCLVASAVDAADFGVALKGRVTYSGVVNPAVIVPDKDVAECGKKKLLDESLVVNPANSGLANVVVALYSTDSVPVHPDVAKRFRDPVKVDNRGCRFEPRIALAVTKQVVHLINSDGVSHNMKVNCVENAPINPILPPMTMQNQTFAAVERLPTEISCGIHPWMKGWLYIRDNPYMTVSNANGDFEIASPPSGDWEFLFWHEATGYLKNKIDGKTPKKGRVTLSIPAGKPKDIGTFRAN